MFEGPIHASLAVAFLAVVFVESFKNVGNFKLLRTLSLLLNPWISGINHSKCVFLLIRCELVLQHRHSCSLVHVFSLNPDCRSVAASVLTQYFRLHIVRFLRNLQLVLRLHHWCILLGRLRTNPVYCFIIDRDEFIGLLDSVPDIILHFLQVLTLSIE